ncbi:hypothetical protein [Streptomyces sp. RKAG293]|uniref:hypothetical protein n=1 Tax=Streptomyces sp. RKAG293 TaxID=2893403 RepID=UPI002033CB43|nr:hypothetical protein [Streptomyces sp. RKAG293]MCM2416509.1 hypothetical protein [Streptomyces sp. RKAG293]
MSSFQHRKAVGDAHEVRVAQELIHRGWAVNPWGQGVLTDPVRYALRESYSSLRWTPDLIAAKDRQVTLIDCKSRMTSRATCRHVVERAAVHAHLQLVAWTMLPVYYVFDNLDVLTPSDVLTAGQDGPRTPAGSGTPYYLIPAGRSLPFDTTFETPPPHHQLPAAA